MSNKLYKYIGPKILEISTAQKGIIGFKCSFPKDYNDPYELFLSIDAGLEPELLAFYKESVGEVPQLPTTCFSKSPVVVPMWAHYGHSSRGFVIEVDEDKLNKYFDDVSIENVTYTDRANEEIASQLMYAFGTCKPRHTFFFHKLVMASAYFSKQSCWNYEQERRVIVPKKYIEDVGENMIFPVPTECISSIIAGARVENEYLDKAKAISNLIGCTLYEGYIGISHPEIYLKDEDSKVCIFDGEAIVKAAKICQTCFEPLYQNDTEKKVCSWCSITEAHEKNAAGSNPYRVLQHAGILESHIKGMEDIFRGKS
jgi:hypothetical protein